MRATLLIVFAHLCLKVAGQSNQIDSLQQLIAHESDPKRKVELLNKLSFAQFDVDIEQANVTTEQALLLTRQIKDRKNEGWALAYRGIYFFLSGQLADARIYFEQSLKSGIALSDKNLQTYSLTQLGNVFRDKGVYDSARQYYQQAKKTSFQQDDLYYQSVVNMNLGRYFLIIQEADSALSEIQEAIKKRESLKDSILLADSWILMGNAYRSKDDFKMASQFYQKAFPFSKNDKIIEADYLQNMGEIHFRNGDFEKAVENWSQVLTFHRKYQYKYALAELLWRMGTVFEEQGYFDLANEYLANGLAIAEKSSYQFLIGEFHHEQAWVYYRSSNFELGLASIKKSEEVFRKINAKLEIAGCWDLRGLIERNLKHYDSSLYYHKKSLAERIRIGNKVDISSSLFNTGEFYLKTGETTQALPFYFKSLRIDAGIGDNYGISLNYNRIGKIYTLLGVYDSAKFYLDRSMELAIPISSNEIFRDNYIDIAAYFEKLGKPLEAITYYKKYNQLTDSIFSKQTAQSLAAYRTLYDVERNEQQIQLLNKDNELSRALVQKQRTLLYSVVGGALILLALVGFYFRFNLKLRKLNAELAEKNEEIQAQSEELTEANEALSKLNRDIAEQKEEIQAQAEELTESNQNLEERIEARTSELKEAFKELDTFFYRSSHDFRRPLTTFMGLAEVARVLVKDQTALELFEKVNENALNLDKMLRKLQSISDVGSQELIYKEVFLKEIMEIELDNLKPELDKKKIRTTLSVKLEHGFYSYGALIKIIVQNLLENSIAFSTSSSPYIHLSAVEHGHEVLIEVQDNGMGIEPEYIERVFEMYFRASEQSKGNGLGLYIVKKTVQKINGRVELESIAGKGTIVRVYFPHRID